MNRVMIPQWTSATAAPPAPRKEPTGNDGLQKRKAYLAFDEANESCKAPRLAICPNAPMKAPRPQAI